MNKKHIEEQYKIIFNQEPTNYLESGGRFELLGNHVDHNHGKTLAATCSLVIASCFRKENNNVVKFYSLNNCEFSISLDDVSVKQEEIGTTVGLVKGVAAYFKNHGFAIGGFSIYMESSIPPGSGVSSSAAFEVLIGKVINVLYNDGKVSLLDICKAGQYSENNYFGKKSGLLDQIACASMGISYIDFNNIDNPEIQILDNNFDGYHFVIVDTGKSHADMSDIYSGIPNDMYAVAKAMGHNYLVEGSLEELESIKDKINELQYLRAEHFYNENMRVDIALKALKNNDIKTFLKCVQGSEISSRNLLKNAMINDVYEGSLAEAIDRANKAMNYKGASKINGGGFAGTIITIVPDDEYINFVNIMKKYYGENHIFPVDILRQR